MDLEIMSNRKKLYKYCMVPKCKNTTIKTPNKIFFQVPKDIKLRKKWCRITKRSPQLPQLSHKTPAYCCEDHFNVEEDMENYIKYKLVGGRVKLKKGVLPHKFDCQRDKNKAVPAPKPAYVKRRRIEFYEQLFSKDIPVLASSTLASSTENKAVPAPKPAYVELEFYEKLLSKDIPVLASSTLASSTEFADCGNIKDSKSSYFMEDCNYFILTSTSQSRKPIPVNINQKKQTCTPQHLEKYDAEKSYKIKDSKSSYFMEDCNNFIFRRASKSRKAIPVNIDQKKHASTPQLLEKYDAEKSYKHAADVYSSFIASEKISSHKYNLIQILLTII